MGATATVRKSDFIDAMEENQKDVRKMVMDSYHDIEKGKGKRDNRKRVEGVRVYGPMKNHSLHSKFSRLPCVRLHSCRGRRHMVYRL